MSSSALKMWSFLPPPLTNGGLWDMQVPGPHLDVLNQHVTGGSSVFLGPGMLVLVSSLKGGLSLAQLDGQKEYGIQGWKRA